MKLCPYCHNPLSDADVNQLRDENAKLRELVRDMWLAANIADIKVCVKDGDWRTLGERVYEALGVEVDA